MEKKPPQTTIPIPERYYPWMDGLRSLQPREADPSSYEMERGLDQLLHEKEAQEWYSARKKTKTMASNPSQGPNERPAILYSEEVWSDKATAEDRVIDLYLGGVCSPRTISLRTDIPVNIVRSIINRAKLREKATQIKKEVLTETLHEKVPLLKEVVDLSLTAVRDWLQELVANEDRKEALSAAEIAQVANIAKNLNEMMRLELGKATHRVEVNEYNFQETKVVLQQLKEDPVFGEMYKSLPDIDVPVDVTPEDEKGTGTGNS